MDEELYKVEKLLNEGNPGDALELLNSTMIDGSLTIDRLLLRAKICYRLQKWGEALNDLNMILAQEPENSMAKNYKSMILDIITFWNKDNFNP
jgi:hypothetical protein